MAPNNLKILAYNILKSLGNDLVKDMKIPELGPCLECNNEILSLNLRPFTTLSCGHTYHRLCGAQHPSPKVNRQFPYIKILDPPNLSLIVPQEPHVLLVYSSETIMTLQ
ncbi:hypothetical protein RhiirA5_427135 [Rhizophagus irregularis]|uniref:Uncharacterized protein n=1 Tax=Rhizophagus irregularis TaxID=588596 RepID=A0A2I1E9N8_9GLOM|nr:hypothetical protein RhiirA5_427135 [Rhizophagus irregularis]PKY18826.1 hypothetical protein RhiirB3_431725 [Rhizophagus irregularis]